MAAEAAGGVGRVLVWVLPPVLVVGIAGWLVWQLHGAARWAALAVLGVVALVAAARFRLLAPATMTAVVAGVAWLVWYAVDRSTWWPVLVVAGFFLVGLLGRGRVAYWRAMMR